jgi:CRP-like cAMP-binding protein
VAIGLLAPLAVAASRRALGRLDDEMRVRDADIETLRAVPMLETLPVPTIEQLAAALEHAEAEPGQTLVRQGERGEYFYILRSGRADVLQDERLVRTLGAGECFGEIALLDDRPRTATVRAAAGTQLDVSRLRRSVFLTAVTGYPAAAAAGDELAASRLEADAERSARGSGGAAGTAQAQHVGEPAASDAEGSADPLEWAGLWQRGQ